MPGLIIFILLLALVSIRLNGTFSVRLRRIQADFEQLRSEQKNLSRAIAKLKEENLQLERQASETTALYDITREICKTLEEEKVLALLREQIDRYLKVDDCLFIRQGESLDGYKDYTVLPLSIQNKTVGYLVAKGVRERESEKFFILAGQFLIGIKRAYLYRKIQELAITDSLTRVFSRRYFLERFREEVERSRKQKYELSFLMVDIDHFKEINDNYGHLVGDAILREVSTTIKENIRQMDFMGRYGGEELSIVLPETDKEQAVLVAERIRKTLESKQMSIYDERLGVTISIGISTFPKDSADLGDLIDRSDEALYQAKQSGRNRVCIYAKE
ncbi:MAG: diguanylate cyclase [Candidatus Omnitrophica bacterium]|nr:diguanylate cyclase [Candidatus Omnitrophota bacterium]